MMLAPESALTGDDRHQWDRFDRPRTCKTCGFEEHDGSGIGYRRCSPEAAPMREDVTQQELTWEQCAEKLGWVFQPAFGQWYHGDVSYGVDDAESACDSFGYETLEAARIAVGVPFREQTCRLAHTARPDAGDEVERVARLEAIRDVVSAAYYACEDSEDRGGESIHIPRTQFASLSEALDRIDQLMPDAVQPALPAVLVSLVMEDLSAMREGVDRGMVERECAAVRELCAGTLDDLADAEDRQLRHHDEPSDRARSAVIAAEFRRAAKLVRARPINGRELVAAALSRKGG